MLRDLNRLADVDCLTARDCIKHMLISFPPEALQQHDSNNDNEMYATKLDQKSDSSSKALCEMRYDPSVFCANWQVHLWKQSIQAIYLSRR